LEVVSIDANATDMAVNAIASFLPVTIVSGLEVAGTAFSS
jgi:hypothetical protein